MKSLCLLLMSHSLIIVPGTEHFKDTNQGSSENCDYVIPAIHKSH